MENMGRLILSGIRGTARSYPKIRKEVAVFGVRSIHTDDYIVKSEAKSPEVYDKGNIAKFVFKESSSWKNLVALESTDTGNQITYSQLKDQCARWSGFLLHCKISKGDVVASFAKNCPEYVPVIFGTGAHGAIISPMSSTLKSGEIANMLRINEPKMVVYDPALEEILLKSLMETRQDPVLVSFGSSQKGANIYDILNNNQIPLVDPVDISGNEVFLMPFSSGTTGFPKGVAISHNALSMAIKQMSNPYFLKIEKPTDLEQHSMVNLYPYAHIGGALLLLQTIFKGFKGVTFSKLTSDHFVSALKSLNITHLPVIPTVLSLLADRSDVNAKDMPCLQVLISGGSPVPTPLILKLKEKLNTDLKFHEVYGMTESLISHVTPHDTSRIENSLKLVSDVEAKILDLETRLPLPPNTPGELCLKTEAVMVGYVKNEKATRESFTDDGWLLTGDVATYDEEGYFKITDRLKDFIKVKGYQVSPSELEDELLKHPAVLTCSIIGVPHNMFGEAPKAFVVKKGDVTEKELQNFIKERMAKQKQLAGGVTFVEDLPKNNTGKVLRTELRKWT